MRHRFLAAIALAPAALGQAGGAPPQVLCGELAYPSGAAVEPAQLDLYLLDYEGPLTSVRARCESAGTSFAFLGAPGLTPRDVGRFSYLVMVSSEHHMGIRQIHPPTNGAPVTVRMVEQTVVEGRTVDEGGKGLVGVSVEVESVEEDSVWSSVPYWRVQTDASGRFKLPRMPKGRGVRVWIEHADWVEHLMVVVPGERIEEVVLQPGAKLAGRVLRPDGTPGSGARVWCAATEEVAYARALTDGQGRFLLTSIPEGEYLLWVEAKDGVAPARTVRAAKIRTTTDCGEIRLQEGILCRGQLRTADGKAVGAEYASIIVYGPPRPAGPGPGMVFWAREDGSFEMRLLPGDYSATFLNVAGFQSLAGPTKFVVPDGAANGLEVVSMRVERSRQAR